MIVPHLKWIDLALAALLVLLGGFVGPATGIFVPQLVYGILWLALGWRMRLPLVLVALLLVEAANWPGMEAADLWRLNYGLGLWVICMWIPARIPWVGWGLGALWGLLCWWAPEFWLCALLLLPKLSLLQPGRQRAMTWSAMVVGGGVLLTALLLERTGDLFTRPAEAQTYQDIVETFQELFTIPSLGVVLALVGLFDLAQPTEESHAKGWTALAMLAVPVLFLFLPPARAMPLLMWFAFPSLAGMLTRWTLAFSSLPARIVLWIGLITLGALS